MRRFMAPCTLIPALLGAVLSASDAAWSQQVEAPVAPGSGSQAGGAGGASVGSASPGAAAPLTGTPAGGSMLQGALPAPGGAAVGQAAAQPVSLEGPSPAQPSAAPRIQRPQGASALPFSGTQRAPAAIPGSDAVPPSEGEKVKELQLQIQDIDKARRAEGAGAEGAVRLSVGRFFHGEAKGRAPGASPVLNGTAPLGAAAVAMPDVGRLGPEATLREIGRLVGTVGAAQQPAWYRRAAEIALEHLGASQASKQVRSLMEEAEARAPAAVKLLSQSALEAAGSGAPGAEAAASAAMKGLGEWDSLLSKGGRPYIDNLGEIRARLERALAESRAEPALRRAAPRVAFSVIERTPAGARLRAEITEGRALPASVEPVPPAVALDLLEAGLGAAEAAIDPPPLPLMDAFLAAAAEEGLLSSFRARRAEGRGLMESLSLALTDWLRGRGRAAERWWRRAWTAFLQLLGYGRGAPVLIEVDSSGLGGPLRSYDVTEDPRPGPVVSPVPVFGGN